MCLGDGRRRSAHPQGTCPDASQPELDSGLATTSRRLHAKHAARELLWPSDLRPSAYRDLARVADVLQWYRSLADRLPRDMAEAVAPAWDASVAPSDALSCLVGCTDTILIRTGNAVHCMAG